jgi:hypothetical protein
VISSALGIQFIIMATSENDAMRGPALWENSTQEYVIGRIIALLLVDKLRNTCHICIVHTHINKPKQEIRTSLGLIAKLSAMTYYPQTQMQSAIVSWMIPSGLNWILPATPPIARFSHCMLSHTGLEHGR